MRRCGQPAYSANSASSSNAGVLEQRGRFLLCPAWSSHIPLATGLGTARKQKLTHQARGNMGRMGPNGNQHDPPGNRRPRSKSRHILQMRYRKDVDPGRNSPTPPVAGNHRVTCSNPVGRNFWFSISIFFFHSSPASGCAASLGLLTLFVFLPRGLLFPARLVLVPPLRPLLVVPAPLWVLLWLVEASAGLPRVLVRGRAMLLQVPISFRAASAGW